jgi:WS/DGAT/MGAT family acyltransferase
MKQLSGLDATFLYMETPETPMHVGSLNLYELPAGSKGSFHKAVLALIAKRLHLAPIFTRKLAFMPFDLGHPVWVEAGEVDLKRHIRKVAMPPGSTVAEVQAECARLHGELIDREHPLWEFHVFDKVLLPDGRRVAGLYSKIHHAALDGKGGTVLANAMLDVGPVPREVPPPQDAGRARGRADLKVGEMIGAVFSNSLTQYAKLARALPGAASALGGTLARQSLGAPKGEGLARLRPKMPITLAPRTLFNASITPHRVFATTSLPFAECRAMAKTVGGSFNDIVLWLCSTALRSYLAEHGGIPRKSLVVAMPVSLREESNKELNNQASMSLVELGTHLADPLRRMNAIMASTAKVKTALVKLKSVLPTDYPSFLAPWLVGGAAKAYGKSGIADRLPMVANLAISNVPGPSVPLYMAGARMISFHPLSIVIHGLALNITVQTYAGSVDFGIIGDRKAVPHIEQLAGALEDAFALAQKLFCDPATAAASVKTPVPKATRSKKAPSKKAVPIAATVRAAATAKKRLHAPSHGQAKKAAIRANP